MMQLLRRGLRGLRPDSGATIPEVAVAMLVMSVAVIGVIGSMAAGMGLVGHSRQRTNGSGVAQERLERARNVPYSNLAIKDDPAVSGDTPTHNAATGHPNNKVTTDNLRYRVEVNGTTVEEPLVIRPNIGIPHIEDPFNVGQTEFVVHQYVTWVDDPSIAGTENYKRLTVVVRWKFPVRSTTSHVVTMSTLVSDGTVTVPGATSTPVVTSEPPPGPTPSAPPAQLGVGTAIGPYPASLSNSIPESDPCDGNPAGEPNEGGNKSPPVISKFSAISSAGDAGYLSNTSVQIAIAGSDPDCYPITVYMSTASDRTKCNVEGQVNYAPIEPLMGQTNGTFDETLTRPIPSGDGPRALCAVLRNPRGTSTGRSVPWGFDYVLDTVNPSIPTGLAQTACTISGNDRTVSLQWNEATDTNLKGYRVYRSIADGAYTPIPTQPSGLSRSASDTTLKTYNVRYMVRAYDKAALESADSNVISYFSGSKPCVPG